MSVDAITITASLIFSKFVSWNLSGLNVLQLTQKNAEEDLAFAG